MTFYVEKRLALGPISFGVTPGQKDVDDDPALSTGATGEFLRRGNERFFFGGHDAFSKPALEMSVPPGAVVDVASEADQAPSGEVRPVPAI